MKWSELTPTTLPRELVRLSRAATDIKLVPNTRADDINEPARAGEVIYNFADYGKAKENSGLSRVYSRAASATIKWFESLGLAELTQSTNS